MNKNDGFKRRGWGRTGARGAFSNKSLPQDADRAEKLREAIDGLCEASLNAPVIVEGNKDAAALRSLGLQGDLIPLHGGKTIHEFCEEITERYDRVILLLDWDAKGEILLKSLERGLKGIWEEFSPFRVTLKNLCQKDIKDIEGIPALLKRLEGPIKRTNDGDTPASSDR